jgi:hypothetical protein
MTPALLTAVPFFPHRSIIPPAFRLPARPPTVYALVMSPNAESVMSRHVGSAKSPLRDGGMDAAEQMSDEEDELSEEMW